MKISPTPPEISFNTKSIEKLLNDSAYKELIQISANFNTRLRVERKLRFPFLDPQTGVAQRHSNLYMKKAQRLPGLREGQIYTYPSVRWRNKKNSFLKLSSRPFFRFRANDNCATATSSSSLLNPVNHTATTTVTSNSNGIAPADDNSQVTDFQAIIDAESNSLTGGADTDSNSQEIPKEWSYYDDMDANDGVSEEQPDSDFDYNVNGYKRKKKGTVRKPSRKPKDSFGMFGSESTEKASTSRGKRSAGGGGSSRSNNRSSKKGTSSSSRSSKSKTEKTLKASPPSMYDEPPSFDSVQGDLKLDGSDSFAYRKY